MFVRGLPFAARCHKLGTNAVKELLGREIGCLRHFEGWNGVGIGQRKENSSRALGVLVSQKISGLLNIDMDRKRLFFRAIVIFWKVNSILGFQVKFIYFNKVKHLFYHILFVLVYTIPLMIFLKYLKNMLMSCIKRKLKAK